MMTDAKIIPLFPRVTEAGVKRVYHYCSLGFHLANCVGWNSDGSPKLALVSDHLPNELDDRELLFELNPFDKHLQPLEAGRYAAWWPAATSRLYSVARVTYWHRCTKWRHSRVCRKAEKCLIECSLPELGEKEIAIRLHPPVDLVEWVVENKLLGRGHYEVPGKVFE
jgi:hypothetical protein